MLTLITSLSLGTFFASFFLYNLFDFFNLKRWFLDRPDQLRKTQKEAVPRYGGLVIAIICLTALLMLPVFEPYRIVGILGIIIFLMGALDDLFTLRWTLKSIIQFAMGLYLASVYITPLETVDAFGYTFFNKGYYFECLFLIWFLGLTNSINLIDGLDGLAGGLSVILCLPLLLIGIQAQILTLVVLMTIILSTIFVFLVYNSKPARLYMGDSGSLFLGYIFSLLPIFFIEKTATLMTVDISHILVLYAYIITDTLRVMVARFKMKKHPMTPDRGHLHHLLLDSTSSYNGTLFLIFLIATFLSLVVLNAPQFIQTQSFGILFYTLFLIFIFSVKIRNFFINLCTKGVTKIRHYFHSQDGYSSRYARQFVLLSLISNVIFCVYVMRVSSVPFKLEMSLMIFLGFLFFFGVFIVNPYWHF